MMIVWSCYIIHRNKEETLMKPKPTNAKELEESKVVYAMDSITGGIKKVLMDYVICMYLASFGKVIAYLGIESIEGKDLLSGMDEKTRNTVSNFAYGLSKFDPKVVSEVEHILKTSGMDFSEDYKTIKQYLFHTPQEFAEKTIKNFREETPVFQNQLNKCIFCFEDILMLDDRAIQKIIQKVDQQTLAKALKGSAPEIQDKIFRNMTKRDASMLKKDMKWMCPVRLTDVEACQSDILKIIFSLEEKGKIVISRIQISDILID